MPVWIEPKGSKKIKLRAFVAYLHAMHDRCLVNLSAAQQDPTWYGHYSARADVFRQVAAHLEGIIDSGTRTHTPAPILCNVCGEPVPCAASRRTH